MIALLKRYSDSSAMPNIELTDIIEIIIISFIVYQIIRWFKSSRAWMIVKGIVVLLVFTLISIFFQFDTILWMLSNSVAFAITAAVIIFQPELRRALEELGRKNLVASFLSFDSPREEEGFSEKTINEIIKAVVEMGKAKTGALIVIEQAVALGEYERTGIHLDAVVSSQLLINIFEHNTPLHDGAIIVRGNRIVSATCYLPLTDSLELGKELGTRHRAAVGISEVSDSYTIVVSEETGGISLAHERSLIRNLNGADVKDILMRSIETRNNEKSKFKLWKGRRSHEDKVQ
ncbi:MAG: diadenylate cyclase CdaA [Lachnospiraceae bacterium]|nr:diadenylate cyclase CdaA [Lachnospiraceae bacterium]